MFFTNQKYRKMGWLRGLRRCIANAFTILNNVVRRFESYSQQLLKIVGFNKVYYFSLKLLFFVLFWFFVGYFWGVFNIFYFFISFFKFENICLKHFFFEKIYLVVPFGLYRYPAFVFFDNYPDLTITLVLIFRVFRTFLLLSLFSFFLVVVRFCWLFFFFSSNVIFLYLFIIVFVEDERPLSPQKLREYKLFFKYGDYVVLKTRRQRTDEEKVRRFYERVIRPGNVTKYIEENYLKKGEKF